jgi:hypothetical protein
MRSKFILTALMVLLPAICISQFMQPPFIPYHIPQAISYQAVARDAGGNPYATQNLVIRFTILEGAAMGTTLYQETHSVTTNQFGLFSVGIGWGTSSLGDFSNIRWEGPDRTQLTPHFLRVEMVDPNNPGSFMDMGTQQLLSVPYAMVAGRSILSDGIDVDTTGIQQGNVLKWIDTTWVPRPDLQGSGGGDNDWTVGLTEMWATNPALDIMMGNTTPPGGNLSKVQIQGPPGAAAPTFVDIITALPLSDGIRIRQTARHGLFIDAFPLILIGGDGINISSTATGGIGANGISMSSTAVGGIGADGINISSAVKGGIATDGLHILSAVDGAIAGDGIEIQGSGINGIFINDATSTIGKNGIEIKADRYSAQLGIQNDGIHILSQKRRGIGGDGIKVVPEEEFAILGDGIEIQGAGENGIFINNEASSYLGSALHISSKSAGGFKADGIRIVSNEEKAIAGNAITIEGSGVNGIDITHNANASINGHGLAITSNKVGGIKEHGIYVLDPDSIGIRVEKTRDNNDFEGIYSRVQSPATAIRGESTRGDGLLGISRATPYERAGVHAVGNGAAGGAPRAAALRIHNGAITVSGSNRPADIVPVPELTNPIYSCDEICPECSHRHVIGHSIDIWVLNDLVVASKPNNPKSSIIQLTVQANDHGYDPVKFSAHLLEIRNGRFKVRVAVTGTATLVAPGVPNLLCKWIDPTEIEPKLHYLIVNPFPPGS